MRLKIIPILAILMITISAAALYQRSFHISCTGKIKVIGLKCSIETVDWGVLGLGESKTVSFQLNSTSTISCRLSMITENWVPMSIGTVTWNLEGYVIAPNEPVTAEVTIHVFENVTGITNFSFDMVIVASEV